MVAKNKECAFTPNNEYIMKVTSSEDKNLYFNINYKAAVNVYNVEVENNIDKVTIESTLYDKKSTYIEDYSNKTVDLKVGMNTFVIQVKAENESINKYTINIIRKDKNPI